MNVLLPRVSVAVFSVAIAAALGWACCKRPPPPALQACKDPIDHRLCDTSSCGTNAPAVNGFPITGVRPNGQCNSDGVQMIPGSLSGGHAACDGTTLELEGNKLVAVNSDGVVVCREGELEGASFEVRSWVDDGKSRKKSRRIVIQDVAPYTPDHGETRTAYRMVADKPGTKDSLCSSLEAADFRESLGLDPPAPLNPSPSADRDVVIPVSSELYDVFGRPIVPKDSPPVGQPWLHFACVHDALAKRSLYGLHTDNAERSRAALKMLTANYCGGKPLTLRGLEIAWCSGAQTNLEARWSSQGATCVSSLRATYMKEPAFQNWPHALKSVCGPEGKDECSDLEAWKENAVQCHTGSTTTKLEPCAPSSGPTCDHKSFESYVVRAAGGP
jgi:hypothetical protein